MAATAVTLNIDNTLLPTAASALAWKGGYSAFLVDGITPNPVTKNAFAKIQLIAYVFDCIADYNAQQAQAAVVAPASNLIS
jgi:hypothetical protein